MGKGIIVQMVKRWLVVVMVALTGLAPGLAVAQTPVVATPTGGPGIQVTVLAETGALTMTPGEGTPAPLMPSVEHRLERVTMEPGLGFRSGVVTQSMLIYVESGSISLSAQETDVSVDVGDGQPILSGDGETVLCEQDICIVQPGQEVVLGSGNSFAMVQDTVHVNTVGNEAAVFEMSSVVILDDRPLCWICPTT